MLANLTVHSGDGGRESTDKVSESNFCVSRTFYFEFDFQMMKKEKQRQRFYAFRSPYSKTFAWAKEKENEKHGCMQKKRFLKIFTV